MCVIFEKHSLRLGAIELIYIKNQKKYSIHIILQKRVVGNGVLKYFLTMEIHRL